MSVVQQYLISEINCIKTKLRKRIFAVSIEPSSPSASPTKRFSSSGLLLDSDSADAFDQPHKLVAHGLVIETGECAAHSQIDRICHQGLQFLSGLADGVPVGLEVR
jgi:hypothetical protein